MSLHTLASHLQSAGRGDDKVLVHMTPGEVGGLQSLARAHGGSLTINPQTGLPEAGFLKSLLPMLAGAALSFIPGVGPLMAAGIVGGGTAVATGSLQKGLMAGLGAYGGAGLGAGLASSGAAANAANSAALSSTVAPGAASSAAGNSALGSAIGNAQAANAASLAQSTAGQTAAGAIQSQTPSMLANVKTGLGALTQSGGPTALYNALPKGTLPTSYMALSAAQQPSGTGGNKKSPGMIRPYAFERTVNQDAFAPKGNVWDGPVSSKEQDYFTDKMQALPIYAAPGPEYNKKGGVDMFSLMNSPAGAKLAGATPPPGIPNNPMNKMYQAWLESQLTGTPMPQMASANPMSSPMGIMGNPVPTMATGGLAGGGISHLGGYSDGGRLLKGPGDGVSDSIPAVIGDRQPARLADGEFVVPARIVSELGNGSTEAGAKRLYAMMDRVQKARRKTVGKNHVAKDTNAEKYLPA